MVDAAVEAARKAAQPARKTFAIGFQTGHEINWLPQAMHVLRDELKNIQVTVFSDYSEMRQIAGRFNAQADTIYEERR